LVEARLAQMPQLEVAKKFRLNFALSKGLASTI
jgi:hypothetical protein